MEDDVLELETVDILREVETMKVPDMLAASIVELLLFGFRSKIDCFLRAAKPANLYFLRGFFSKERKTCVKETHTHKTYV